VKPAGLALKQPSPLPRLPRPEEDAGVHVMLIEDDPLVREMVLDGLSAAGITVEGLASAEDALVLLTAGQVPDVIVADIDLGSGLSGVDLAAIARERHPDVALVIISGGGLAGASVPAGQRFLPKPFGPDELVRAIRDAAAEAARAAG
jgi:DNA-binding NtrC family response regulator